MDLNLLDTTNDAPNRVQYKKIHSFSRPQLITPIFKTRLVLIHWRTQTFSLENSLHHFLALYRETKKCNNEMQPFKKDRQMRNMVLISLQ